MLRTFLPLEVLANQIELMEDASLCQEATKACKILENYYSELEEFEQLGDILKIRWSYKFLISDFDIYY